MYDAQHETTEILKTKHNSLTGQKQPTCICFGEEWVVNPLHECGVRMENRKLHISAKEEWRAPEKEILTSLLKQILRLHCNMVSANGKHSSVLILYYMHPYDTECCSFSLHKILTANICKLKPKKQSKFKNVSSEISPNMLMENT